MNIAYLGLGSNLGDRKTYLEEASALITEQAGKILLSSSVYETAAWGSGDQPDYLNQVIQIQTELFPLTLLKSILSIEKALGRERKQKWGNRTIDIDLLFYQDYYFQTPQLILPHPWLHERKFVLTPLAEIAPGLIHPAGNKTISELLHICSDQNEVSKI